MSDKTYNPQKARTKYACPIWVDAFLRDTLDLEADEFGAYHLILYAMWSREACNMPDDDRKLARVSRCSTKLWRSRIRPTLEPFFNVGGGVWTNTRLSKEAAKTEKFLKGQSDRKAGGGNEGDTCGGTQATQPQEPETPVNSDKPLETNNPVSTVDDTAEASGEHPTQDTKIPRDKIDDDSAGADLTFREKVLVAAGHDASGVTANGKIVGNGPDFMRFDKARRELSFSEGDALEIVAQTMRQKGDGPPSSLSYFVPPMQKIAGIRDAPAVSAIIPQQVNGAPRQRIRPDLNAIFATNPELNR